MTEARPQIIRTWDQQRAAERDMAAHAVARARKEWLSTVIAGYASTTEAGEALGIDPSYLRKQGREHGLEFKAKRTAVDVDRLRQLADKGMTAQQIADEMQISRQTVASAAYRLKITLDCALSQKVLERRRADKAAREAEKARAAASVVTPLEAMQTLAKEENKRARKIWGAR